MSIDPRAENSPRHALITLVVVVAVLYFARVVLIPFALAILFSFLLAPLVVRLRRWHVGRVPSVICAVAVMFLVIGILGGVVSAQMVELAQKLPEYRQNIHQKIRSVRDSSSGAMHRLTGAIQSFSEQLLPPVRPAQTKPGEEKPVPVEIRGGAFSPLDLIRRVLGSVVSISLMISVVVVFVIFMLFQREDLRDRFIRLIGAGQINVTTKALDDAARRISRYLLAQLALNVAFGVMAGIGLYFLGVPNPILWAVLSAILRYVPYLGIWVGAAMPAAVALAVEPGWLQPLGIFALYFGIDLLVINFAEPLLYGSSTGISPLAILVAAVFWTWLWGPIGLLLATPLTVCLVVVGRYVPSLEFLSILLGDEPVLGPEKRFYQRLLAMDADEAAEVAEQFLKQRKSLEDLYDWVIVPALVLAEENRHHGRLEGEQLRFVYQNARLLAEELAERCDEWLIDGPDQELSAANAAPEPEADTVLCVPARDEADEIGGLMLLQLLKKRRIKARLLSADSLASERLEETAQSGGRVVCVVAVPPFGYLQTRYLCKRLRVQCPKLKIVAAVLDQKDSQELKRRQPTIPADQIAGSLRQAVAEVLSIALSKQTKSEAEMQVHTS